MRELKIGCALASFLALTPKSFSWSPERLGSGTLTVQRTTSEVGVASWYGEECDGNQTASGEFFDMNGLTAAHRQLPIGTKIRVTNLVNHRSLVLKVNDRGPNISGRLLDVSKEAAYRLGFLQSGLCPVRIDVIGLPKAATTRM